MMKLKRAEWMAIALTAAFLLLVAGVQIGSRTRSAPVTVRTAAEPAETAAPAAPPEPAAEPVNLNTATQAQLETLDGVGPALAARIIAYREEHGPFARTEDITLVRGIAEQVFSENRARMTVD